MKATAEDGTQASIIQQRERDRYFEQADLLRTQTEAAGFGVLDTSMRMLAALNRIASQLANLKDRKIADYTEREIDLILNLPSALISIANCASGGVSMGADGLALREVIEAGTGEIKIDLHREEEEGTVWLLYL
jgi:hypothetical protein